MLTVSHESKTLKSEQKTKGAKALGLLWEQKDLGFFDLELLQKQQSICSDATRSRKGSFSTVCVLGIGGSSLGSIAVIEALRPDLLENKKIIFFDNVDAKSFFRKLDQLPNLQKTLWVLVSKSGNTIETLTQADFVDEYLMNKIQVPLAKNSVVITEDKSSPLYDWASKHQVTLLPVPKNVGGRFSVLTCVGLFLFELFDINTLDLLHGARASLQNKSFLENLTAQFLASFERKETISYFFYYCDDLRYWGLWLQQLWAESLGKKVCMDGTPAPELSAPYPCRGTTDQHSILQQVVEGTQKKFVCFFRVEESEAFGESLGGVHLSTDSLLVSKKLGDLLRAQSLATQQALNESEVQSLTLLMTKLDAKNLGELIMSFQVVVAALGLYYNINPFDQPGVERGKVLTRTILKR